MRTTFPQENGESVRIPQASLGLPVSEAFEHKGPVTDLAFTLDGQSLLTSSQDGTARVLSIQHGSRPSALLNSEFNYDGLRALRVCGRVKVAGGE